MPSYGYSGAEGKGRRRERGESSESRDKRRDNKRKRDAPGSAPPGDKREKADRRDPKREKDRRREEADGPPRKDKDRREKDRRREEGPEAPDERRRRQDHGEAPRREEPQSTPKRSAPESPVPRGSAKAGADKKSWRQDQAEDAEDDQRDLSTDDEARDKKMEAARKRREAIMRAKMADKKSEDPGPSGGEGEEPKEPKEEPKEGGAAAPEKAKEPKEGASADPGEGATSGKQEVVRQAGMGDMFDERAEAADELKKAMMQSAAIGLTGASGEDWDDEEGYYIPKIGEVMGERFLVVETSGGRGVFSNVVRAKDQQAEGEQAQAIVAVKILRANDMMTKAAEQEVSILETLNAADKSDRKHIIRLLSTFAYRKHFCLVFEGMEDDLRGAVKKHTKNKGMQLPAVRAFTKQLIIGLGHMHKHKVIHADIKPDNILIGKGQQVVKFCDLGTAVQFKDISITPYLASRFYRAPEVTLGCPYDEQVDTWALACTLFEIFTGKVLLKSKTNNGHLRSIMELKGKIPGKVIRKGAVWKNHFNDELDFKHLVDDATSGQQVTKIITDLSATRSIKELVMERVGKEKQQSEVPEDQLYCKRAVQFADLLEKMTALDPANRIRPDDALQHAFLQDTPAEKKAAEAAIKQAAKDRQDAARSGRPAK